MLSFPEFVAHAARTREIVAGTIIGSGTVSNADYATVGSSYISEVRAVEIIAGGAPKKRFLVDGDMVSMAAQTGGGRTPIGNLEQQVRIGWIEPEEADQPVARVSRLTPSIALGLRELGVAIVCIDARRRIRA